MSESTLQVPMSTALRQRMISTINGMKRDIRADYSKREFIEQGVAQVCEDLERRYNQGYRWPTGQPLKRGGGVGSGGERTAPPEKVTVDQTIKQRADSVVKGMKAVDARFTLRTLLDLAVRTMANHLEQTHHGGKPWPQEDKLLRTYKTAP